MNEHKLLNNNDLNLFNHFSLLPEEILIIIMHYLGFTLGTRYRLMRVNKSLNLILKNKIYMERVKDVDLRKYRRICNKKLSELTFIDTLIINSCKINDNGLKNLTNLKSLSI